MIGYFTMHLLIIPLVLLLALYFLPTMIGLRKRNAGAIFALNLLLGWTLIGWVAALVWALTVEDAPRTMFVQPTSAQTAPNLTCPVCHTPFDPRHAYCRGCGNRMV